MPASFEESGGEENQIVGTITVGHRGSVLRHHLPEAGAPGLGKDGTLRELAYRVGIRCPASAVCDVVDSFDRPAFERSVEERDMLAAFNLSGLNYPQVPTGAAAPITSLGMSRRFQRRPSFEHGARGCDT